MSKPIISVENVSKRYVVGHRNERREHHSHVALRDVMAQEFKNAARKAADVFRGRQVVQGDTLEEFWALRDVNFEVRPGEVLGIIGRNGAGKSTLLKLLSRITEPTTGRITLRGRVASLLEVGTGFHPELTGRENIYLNGAILGMSRAEIRKKFDQIVAFAEIERFLDTPVKRYSSGMYVRLAFAVAAHLEPEILVVDEVLAVGDSEFQKKCLGKVDDIARRHGRTVLFVSHNLAAVSQIASRAIILDGGALTFNGPVSAAVSKYLAHKPERSVYVSERDDDYEHPYVLRAEAITSEQSGVHRYGEPLKIKIWIRHHRPIEQGHVGVELITQSQVTATAFYAYPPQARFGSQPGTTLVTFDIPALHSNIGQLHLRIWLTGLPNSNILEIVDDACGFEVVRHNFFHWWKPESCVYHEDFTVEVKTEAANTALRANAANESEQV